MKPRYLVPFEGANLKTELFGHEYDAPFGISPVGLQGFDVAQVSGDFGQSRF